MFLIKNRKLTKKIALFRHCHRRKHCGLSQAAAGFHTYISPHGRFSDTCKKLYGPQTLL